MRNVHTAEAMKKLHNDFGGETDALKPRDTIA